MDDILAPEGTEEATELSVSPSSLAMPSTKHQLRQSGADRVIVVTATASRTPEQVLRRAVSARDVISVVPWERWDVEKSLTEDMPARFGGFMSGVQLFDAGLFGLSEKEAVMVDPQQRMLLEAAFDMMSAAGPGTAQQPQQHPGLKPAETGVFVGISTPDYADLKKLHTPIGVYSATGSALSVAAGRLSFMFGLKGPSVSIDTACSSSLVGMHMAARNLLADDCSAAMVFGIKLILTPSLSAMFTRAGQCWVVYRFPESYLQPIYFLGAIATRWTGWCFLIIIRLMPYEFLLILRESSLIAILC